VVIHWLAKSSRGSSLCLQTHI